VCHRYGMHSVVANLLSRLNDEVFVYTPPPSGSGPKPVVTLTPGAGAKPAGGTLEEVRAADYHEAWVQCTSASLKAASAACSKCRHLLNHLHPPLISLCPLWSSTLWWPCLWVYPWGEQVLINHLVASHEEYQRQFAASHGAGTGSHASPTKSV
jgi:hypothetical protein